MFFLIVWLQERSSLQPKPQWMDLEVQIWRSQNYAGRDGHEKTLSLLESQNTCWCLKYKFVSLLKLSICLHRQSQLEKQNSVGGVVCLSWWYIQLLFDINLIKFKPNYLPFHNYNSKICVAHIPYKHKNTIIFPCFTIMESSKIETPDQTFCSKRDVMLAWNNFFFSLGKSRLSDSEEFPYKANSMKSLNYSQMDFKNFNSCCKRHILFSVSKRAHFMYI